MDIDLHSDSHRLARHRMRYQRRLLSQRYGSSSCRIDKIHSRPSLPRPNQASTCTHCPANRERACPGRLCCSRIDRYTQAWTKQDAPQNTLPNGNDRCENHPAPPVPASSGGGVGWGRVGMSCEHIPPAPSPAALGARASGALITCAIRHRRFPPPAGAGEGGGGSVCLASTPPPPSPAALGARASGALPTCAIRRRRFLPPAGAGQGRGGSAYPASAPLPHPHRQHWERAPPARSSPAPFGAAGSCLQRVQGRVGAGRCVLRARHRLPHRQHCERAPPARSLPANQDLMSSLPGNGATAFRHTRSTDEVGSIPPVPLCPGTGVDVVLWTPRLYDMGDESE